MTIEEIENRIKEIENDAGDDEAQHSAEDNLYLDFIKYVSKGSSNDIELMQMAKRILRVSKMDFARYCS